MKKLILSLLVLWIFPFQNVYGSVQTYTDAKHHFSIEFPEGWTIQDIPKIDGVEYIAAFKKGDVYPYILIQQFNDSGSLKELKSTFDDKFTKLNESNLPISIMSYGGSTIHYDKNALLYSYTAKNESNEAFEGKGALFVGSGISTQLMYYADIRSDENEEDFNFIIDKFQYAEGYKVLKNDSLGDAVASAIAFAIIVGVITIMLTIRRSKNNSLKTAGISINESDKDIVQWFYIKNTQKQGPFNEDEIFNLYFKNEINEGTFLWKPGIKAWAKLKDIPYLNKHLLQPPPIHDGSNDIIIDKSELIYDIENVSTDEIQVDKDSNK